MDITHANEMTEIIDELFEGLADAEVRKDLAMHALECKQCGEAVLKAFLRKRTNEIGAETRIDGE